MSKCKIQKVTFPASTYYIEMRESRGLSWQPLDRVGTRIHHPQWAALWILSQGTFTSTQRTKYRFGLTVLGPYFINTIVYVVPNFWSEKKCIILSRNSLSLIISCLINWIVLIYFFLIRTFSINIKARPVTMYKQHTRFITKKWHK